MRSEIPNVSTILSGFRDKGMVGVPSVGLSFLADNEIDNYIASSLWLVISPNNFFVQWQEWYIYKRGLMMAI